MPTGIRGWATTTALAIASMILVAAPAGAATPLGQIAPTPTNCAGDTNHVQLTVNSGTTYEVPSPGVITSWSYRARSSPASSGRLQVWRPAGASSFTLVGRSDLITFTPGVLNEFPIAIPVNVGDLLGFRVGPGTSGAACGFPGSAVLGTTGGDAAGSSDPAPGETRTLPTTPGLLSVAAILEPDCDQDGLGDETQDALADCAAPEAMLTKVPKDKVKTKKKRATVTFEFTGTDARTIAGFECSLDGATFTACTSPHTVKVKKGEHAFSVRAIDAAGNIDGAPATDSWKVKKKQRKR
jgi:hypothetical protein